MFRSPRLLLVAVALTLTADPARADDPTTFPLKFKENEPFYQKVTTTTKQVMKVAGAEVKQNQEQVFYLKWTPIKQDGDRWQIQQQIEGIQMVVDIGGNIIRYDSTQVNEDQPANAMETFFAAMKGTTFTMTLNTRTRKIEKIDGAAELVEKLGKTNQAMKPLLEKILSDDAVKQMAEPVFGYVPADAKKVGDKWETTSKLDLGPIGSYKNQYRYVYKGRDKDNPDLARLEVTPEIAYAPPANGDGLPFKIKEGELTTQKSKPGVILFNTKTGRLERAEIPMTITGSLKIDVQGMETAVELSQTQQSLTESSDKSLLPKPRAKKP